MKIRTTDKPEEIKDNIKNVIDDTKETKMKIMTIDKPEEIMTIDNIKVVKSISPGQLHAIKNELNS